MKDELLVEKNVLKREKERLSRTHANAWIEPARQVINTLETLGKTDFPEITSGNCQASAKNRNEPPDFAQNCFVFCC
jgi:hypothetical protein